jgi:hypothetical protein
MDTHVSSSRARHETVDSSRARWEKLELLIGSTPDTLPEPDEKLEDEPEPICKYSIFINSLSETTRTNQFRSGRLVIYYMIRSYSGTDRPMGSSSLHLFY